MQFKGINATHTFYLKVLLHVIALALLSVTYYQGFTDQLGADPVEHILHFTGIGAFNLLLLSLAVSPIAQKFKQGQLMTLRRPIGLYAFVYALCHFTSYILFELQLEWSLLISEIVKRPYITVGFVALMLLSALAITSFTALRKQLGRKWQKLHNWVYLAGLLIALHYLWSVKSDVVQPLLYFIILLSLLYFRKNKLIKGFQSRLNNFRENKQSKKKLA